MENSGSGNGSDSVPELKGRRLGIQVENPFTLKVGQVFTGFGIGCGVGIGVGRPLNIGAIPALQQVMSATRGATDAFSGVGRHVNNSLRRFGAKNIEAGIGCGVGFGHGFGVGLAIKPGVIQRIQTCIAQTMVKMMMKFGAVPGLSVGQNMLPPSLQTSINSISKTPLIKDGNLDIGSVYGTLSSKATPSSPETSFGSRTEKVISSFLQNPVLKDEDTQLSEMAGRLRSENNVLQMVLKHQQVIEELMEENEKLRQVLVEELKVPPGKLKSSNSREIKSQNPCSDCFDCRRRQRKQR